MTHADIIWQGITAIVVILTVIASHLSARRDRNEKQVVTAQKIDAVQETVNGTTAALTARTEQLATTLAAVGVPVPPPGPTPVTPEEP